MKRGEMQAISDQEVKTKRKRAVRIKETPSALPTEEQIRSRAMEIYHERLHNGKSGTPESDWFDALESFGRA